MTEAAHCHKCNKGKMNYLKYYEMLAFVKKILVLIEFK